MRTLFRNSLLVFFLLFSLRSVAQNTDDVESLGLPGDNLNLYAVMKIFQESATLEEFEKKLNDPDNRINNLDLDGDNHVDYITVNDEVENNVHSIALKVATGRYETQNVAVFIVDNSNGHPQLQVVGDEDLYGKDYIIEPNYDNNTDKPDVRPNPGYTGNSSVYNTMPAQSQQVIVQRQIISPAEIALWPVIVDIYRPSYVVWRSPWTWGYYPSYWRAWEPYQFHYYYGYHYHWNYYYYGNYRRWYHYRNPWWYDRYYHQAGWRQRSDIYYTRYYRGDYRSTYDRPDIVRYGSADYRKRYPNSPGYNASVPQVKVPERRQPIARPRPLPGNSEYRNDQIINPTRDRYQSPSTRPTRVLNDAAPQTTYPARPVERKPSPASRPTRVFNDAAPQTTYSAKPMERTPSTATRPTTFPVRQSPAGERPATRPEISRQPVARPQMSEKPVTRRQFTSAPNEKPRLSPAPATREVTTIRSSSTPNQARFTPKAAPRSAPQRR